MSRFTCLLPLLATVVILALLGCTPVAGTPVTDGMAIDAPAGSGADSSAEEGTTVVLASHDSFAISSEVLEAFQRQSGITVQLLTLGDAGEALNRLILSKDAPLADLFFGVDNTFLSRAIDAAIFVPYTSPLLDEIPDEFKLDPENRLLPVDFGYINLNADRVWFEEAAIPLPTRLEDLLDPAYKDLLVVQNPATSSPGLAFLLATVGYFGEDGYLDFWRGLRDNGVLVTSGWSEAYYDHFTVGSGGMGARPLVVSYATSPPADVLFAGDGRTVPASVNVNPVSGTFRQVEFVGILAGTANRDAAEQVVDFFLSREFQEDIPLQMFVYPVRSDAELPDLFRQFAQIPSDPVQLAPSAIEANRERWIETWTDMMLR